MDRDIISEAQELVKRFHGKITSDIIWDVTTTDLGNGGEYVFYKDKNEYRDVLVAEFPKEFTAFHTIKYDLGE